MRIGILSDSHGCLPQQLYSFFADVDEIWHAGDIGPGVLDRLMEFKPVVAVHGNVDGQEVRWTCPKTQLFQREGQKILMTHIGGYPKHYEARIRPLLRQERPNLFIAGHSHILRVMYDSDYDLLHINPGACGFQGWHRKRTLVRLSLSPTPSDLEIMELDRYGDAQPKPPSP